MRITAAGAARLAGAGLLLTAVGALPHGVATAGELEAASAGEIAGHYALESQAGGAVWTFEADGAVVILGPGELMAEGDWHPGPLAGLFDAEVEVPVTTQHLLILGAVSPDGEQIAMFVLASEAGTPSDGLPWPETSFLVGPRVGLLADEGGPSPTPVPESSPWSEP